MKLPYVDNRYWFPASHLDLSKVQEHFSVRIEVRNPATPIPEWRTHNLWEGKLVGGKKWVGLPRGNQGIVKSCLRKDSWDLLKDKRQDKYARIKLRMRGKFRKHQKEAIKEMLLWQTGVFTAPPRSGKTVTAVGLIAKLQRKTLILVHQTDLLEQFLQTIQELFGGKEKVAGICREVADFKRYPICLATYQTFLSKKGRRKLAKVKDLFGVVIVDEAHKCPAERYSEVVSQFSAKRVYGCTGTPDRKDGLYLIADRFLGPVRHTALPEIKSPVVYGHDTRIHWRKEPDDWNSIMAMIYENDERNEQIAEQVVADIENGHNVLIPVNRNDWAKKLEGRINSKMGRKVVFLYNGSIPRDKRQETLEKMRTDPNIGCVIATRSMLLGVDIPRWSAIYTVAPISNEPTYFQEVARVLTPMEGKPRPIIRFFLDYPLGAAIACFWTCSKTLRNKQLGFAFDKSYLDLMNKCRKH